MKKVAVMFDLAFVLYTLWRPLGKRNATAQVIHGLAQKCVDGSEEESFRIYCYHCSPYADTQVHPMTRRPVHFKRTPTYASMTQLIQNLETMDGVAYRAGELVFNGWKIKKQSAKEIVSGQRPLCANDFEPDMKQKRVDMKIGLDVAWLASKSIVDRIVLLTGDSDFVPAMKFARREGIQVVFVVLNGLKRIKRDLLVHADIVRHVSFP